MCPVCLSTAALIAGSVTSSGSLAAIAIRKLGGKNAIDNSAVEHSIDNPIDNPHPTSSTPLDKTTGQ